MGEEEVRTLPTPLGLTDFDMGVTLGTGSFGRVRFVTHKVSLQCFPYFYCAGRTSKNCCLLNSTKTDSRRLVSVLIDRTSISGPCATL